jgi:GMP reductase
MATQKTQRPRAVVARLLESGVAFDYDHITLVPRVASTLLHRADARPEMPFGPLRLSLPLLGSPMPDVCGQEMCQALSREGALGVLHRFQPITAQVLALTAAGADPTAAGSLPGIGAAIGVTGDYQERFQALYAAGCRVFCLDTANGAHLQVERTLAWVRGEASDVFVIAGNVASGEAFSWLEERGADAVRVGIAGGAVCETKTETGVYAPTPYTVAEAVAVRKRALVIGDSGVRTPSDFCKLLALGADVVMVGSALAGTREAPGSVIVSEGKKYKIMRGAASFSVQQDIGKSDPEYVEGAETLVPYRGTVTTVLRRYLAGLQSSMSYMDARTLSEYRAHVSFLLLR